MGDTQSDSLPNDNFRILCLYPAEMSASRDENASVFTRIRERGVEVGFIAVRRIWRGKGALPEYENVNGMPVFRLYRDLKETFLFPQRKLGQALRIARDLNPSLILCVQELNMRLALLLQKHLRVPIVLRMEDAGSIFYGSSESQMIRIRCAMRIFGMPSGKPPAFWSWLCEKTDALVTCHPRDQQMLARLSKKDKPVYYLPWPCALPSHFERPQKKNQQRGIYVGSLRSFKNTQEFKSTLPKILQSTQTEEFVVLGTGPQASIIFELQKRFHDEIKYIPQAPKKELLAMIANSYYAYTPVRTGGWGFIGDCWGTKTPIVMTHNDGYVVNGSTALVAKDEDDLVECINRLYKDPKLYESQQKSAFQEYEKRSPTLVGDRLHEILSYTLAKKKQVG